MRSVTLAVVLALVGTLPACTVVGMGTGAGLTAINNSTAKESDQWGYGTPMLIGAGVGLVVDVLIIRYLAKQWSHPMT